MYITNILASSLSLNQGCSNFSTVIKSDAGTFVTEVELLGFFVFVFWFLGGEGGVYNSVQCSASILN